MIEDTKRCKICKVRHFKMLSKDKETWFCEECGESISAYWKYTLIGKITRVSKYFTCDECTNIVNEVTYSNITNKWLCNICQYNIPSLMRDLLGTRKLLMAIYPKLRKNESKDN